MQFRLLGSTGLHVSAIAFGAGPVSELMTGKDAQRQLEVVARAIELGVNWFDTAATYGAGLSESNLGAALDSLGVNSSVHLATKVRIMPENLNHIRDHVRRSFFGSLQRLRVPRVTLVQLHNAITAKRGDEPTSLTPTDLLGAGGVLEAFNELKFEGLVDHFGITSIGQPASLHKVINSGAFETVQVPYNLVNYSAGYDVSDGFREADYGNVIDACRRQKMGVFAIRVFAAGALAGHSPSRHTHKTPFFPLDLYQRDQTRAARLGRICNGRLDLEEAAVRFVLSHQGVSSAIIGFGECRHVEQAVKYADKGSLADDLRADILRTAGGNP
jgi:aryl-alcohol dehydrogenase-like predicted oxidoreductase